MFQLPTHPLLSHRGLRENTKVHGIESLTQSGPTFAQTLGVPCEHWMMM